MEKFSAAEAENVFKQTAERTGTKTGEVMQLFRVLISGVAGGPALFEVAALLGKPLVVKRLENAIVKIS